MNRMWLKVGTAAALFGGAIGAGALVTGAAPGPCGEDAPVSPAGRFTRREGGQDLLAATLGDAVVTVDESGGRLRYAHRGVPGGLLRHAAAHGEHGIAYVNDLEGADRLVLVGPDDGPRELGQPGEVLHPAWSPGGELAWVLDQRTVVVREADGGESRFAAPSELRAVFSPVFPEAGRVIVVGSEPVAGYEGDADGLNNLWELDLGSGRWAPLTGFAAAGEAWSIIRTPVATEDGAILFVRLAGLATSVAEPIPELWRLSDREASMVRTLPPGSFLAGALGGELVLNAPDAAASEWRLLRQRGAAFADLGCGAAMVDPIAGIDPDLGDRAASVGAAAGAQPRAEGGLAASSVAILVGDFRSRPEARAVARRLAVAGGFNVVTNAEASTAVAPGVWAVARPLDDETIPEEALAAFRARFPDLAERTWITTL